MKCKSISLYLLILILTLSICGCGGNRGNGESANNNEITQSANTDYSKYIGSYSIVSDEGTKYESKQTLIIKSIDGKTLDFEYELVPYRHTVTITAEQGVFSSETTAEATGIYEVDGQTMPYGFEFRFNDNSIDLKCGFPDELNEQEYITFDLKLKSVSGSDKENNSGNLNDEQNNKISKDNENKEIQRQNVQTIVTSEGEYNQYTQSCKTGLKRQFIMTIDEFIEHYNTFAIQQQEKRKNGLGLKDDHIRYYQIDKNSAKISENNIMNDEVIMYTFRKICQSDAGFGSFDGAYLDVCVLCYKNTDKIFAVYCQVSETWYEWDSFNPVPKTAGGEITTNEDTCDNIPHDFQLVAYRMFSMVNPKLVSFGDYTGEENKYIINSIFYNSGTNNINYIDGVNYAYYSFTKQDTEYHGLLMHATDFDKRDKMLTLTL